MALQALQPTVALSGGQTRVGTLDPGRQGGERQWLRRPAQQTRLSDDEGVVRAYSVYPAGTGRNIDEIVRLLQALQTGKSCPASWRPGRKTL